jgi:hypothetical protein
VPKSERPVDQGRATSSESMHHSFMRLEEIQVQVECCNDHGHVTGSDVMA